MRRPISTATPPAVRPGKNALRHTRQVLLPALTVVAFAALSLFIGGSTAQIGTCPPGQVPTYSTACPTPAPTPIPSPSPTPTHTPTSPLTTFTVNTTTDTNDGVCNATHCSLREAILAANANAGLDAIAFNIPNAGVQTINVGATGLGALPTVTSPVDINGYTQPGSAVNTATDGSTNAVLLIELNGQMTGGPANGLVLSGGSAGSTVRGLVINRFASLEGLFVAASNVFVGGCFIGTNAQGTAALPNAIGVAIAPGPNNNNGTRIGHAAPAERNLISGNTETGIKIASAFSSSNITDTELSGNLLGTNAQGTAALPNEHGVDFINRNALGVVTNVRIGVPGEGGGNVISGNRSVGVEVLDFGSQNQSGLSLRNNRIGTNAQGTAAIPNGSNPTMGGERAGIIVTEVNNVQIGGANAGEGNLISGNFSHGINLLISNNNIIQGNLIGTNLQGTAAIPNGGNGVYVAGSSNNTVGGTSAGAKTESPHAADHGVATTPSAARRLARATSLPLTVQAASLSPTTAAAMSCSQTPSSPTPLWASSFSPTA